MDGRPVGERGMPRRFGIAIPFRAKHRKVGRSHTVKADITRGDVSVAAVGAVADGMQSGMATAEISQVLIAAGC